MKKKQLFAGALAAAMMTASLAGCGGAASSAATSTTGGDTAGSTASADTNSGVVEVTIPSYKTGENAGAAFFVPQVERFNEKYAGKYKINLESVPQDSIFNDRLKQLAQQNKLPVLVEGGDPDWVKNVVIPNGLAYDLTDWIDATPAIKDVLIDDSREYCSNEDGRVMTMPLATVRPIGFFYNSDMWSTDADISAMSMDEFVSALGDQKIAFSTAENGWVSALFLTALVAEEDGGVEWLKSGTETKITDFNQHCVLAAWEGLDDMALDMYRHAIAIDLGPNMKSSDLGIHSASMGNVWQCVVCGFAGLEWHEGGLSLRSHLPASWQRAAFNIVWRGAKLHVEVTHAGITVTHRGGSAVEITVDGHPVKLAAE